MDPDYSGARSRFQVYHGSTDGILLPPNYNETVKQWTGVFGYDFTSPDETEVHFPAAGYTTDIWGVSAANPLGTVQGIYAVGVGHAVPINGTQDVMWFGLGPYAGEDDNGTLRLMRRTARAMSPSAPDASDEAVEGRTVTCPVEPTGLALSLRVK